MWQRRLIRLLEYVILLILVIFLGMYYINFQAEGETSFVVENTVVYGDLKLTDAIYTLTAGSTFSSLTSFSETDVIKIRYWDEENQKEEIGFIYSTSYITYTFPLEQTNSIKQDIVLSVDENVAFTDFLDLFADALQDYDIVGIYLEASEYSESISDISYFCEEQGIPYGSISEFSEDTVEDYLAKTAREIIENPEGNWSYEILPKVFDITSTNTSIHLSSSTEWMEECICKTTSKLSFKDFNKFWVLDEESAGAPNGMVRISTFEKDFGIEYAFVSTEFLEDVSEKFHSVEENLK